MLTKEEKIDERLAELTKEYMRVEYHTYDILYVSWGWTEDLVNMDYETRHYVLNIQEKLIKAMIPETKEKFHVLTQLENTQENIDFVIASGQEGVMLKLKKGKYKQGTRSKDWVKVKKLITEDAIILGGVEGNGKYKWTLGALIIGQYIEGKLTEVWTISGMDDATRKYFWDWLLEMKLETWADWRDTTKWEIWLGEQDYKAHPETLKIVEFIAQEKTKARYRHPRFVQERLDKNYFECTF